MARGLSVALTPGNRLSLAAQMVKPSGIRTFFDLVQKSQDVISLGIGEPNLVASMQVRMEAVSALVLGNTRYTPNAGTQALREAIAGYLGQRLGVVYDPGSELLVTAGVAQGIDLALRALVNPGDDVLIPEPCFVSYAPCAALAGGMPVGIPLSAANGFVLTPEDLVRHVTPRSRVLVLSYPNNPTGAVMSREQLAQLVPIIEEHDLTVISDEVYSELTYSGAHASLASFPGMRDRVVLLNGFSKTFAMTGWRLGYAAAAEGIIEGMTRLHQHALMCAPTLAQIAGVRALQMVDEIVAEALASYAERRELVHRELLSMGLPCVEPQGAFYAFPEVRSTGMTCEEFAQALLREERVAVIPGNAFGAAGEGHVRLSYATSLDKLEVALERMAHFMDRHRPV